MRLKGILIGGGAAPLGGPGVARLSWWAGAFCFPRARSPGPLSPVRVWDPLWVFSPRSWVPVGISLRSTSPV